MCAHQLPVQQARKSDVYTQQCAALHCTALHYTVQCVTHVCLQVPQERLVDLSSALLLRLVCLLTAQAVVSNCSMLPLVEGTVDALRYSEVLLLVLRSVKGAAGRLHDMLCTELAHTLAAPGVQQQLAAAASPSHSRNACSSVLRQQALGRLDTILDIVLFRV
jgi:hypothetical protein